MKIILIIVISCLLVAFATKTSIVIAGNRMASVTNMPSWKRRGCHKVGYTRLISIPGCGVFNLTTNACRGYCMSYSIPIAEDLGPPEETAANSKTEAAMPMSLALHSSNRDDDLLAEADTSAMIGNNAADSNGNGNWFSVPADYGSVVVGPGPGLSSLVETRKRALYESKNADRTTNNKEVVPDNVTVEDQSNQRSIHHHSKRGLAEFFGLRSSNQEADGAGDGGKDGSDKWQKSATIIGSTVPIGFESAKRDVFSLSQCCSMVETEDILVNVRCYDRTMRFSFKSAKDCRCFYCRKM